MARPRYHLMTSTAVALLVSVGAKSRLVWPASLAAGFFIDLDHFVDYLVRRVKPSARVIILPAHSWELATVLAGLAIATRWRWLVASALAYITHLFIDQAGLFNDQFSSDESHPLRYLLLYRVARGFSAGLFHLDNDAEWLSTPARSLWRWF